MFDKKFQYINCYILDKFNTCVLYKISFTLDFVGGNRKLIYTGLDERYIDNDAELKPWTQYEYMVIVFNSKGQYSSQWDKVRTKEAPPEELIAPKVKVQSQFECLICRNSQPKVSIIWY